MKNSKTRLTHKPKLAILIPVFNEEDCIQICSQTIEDCLLKLQNKNKISEDSYILFIDDGSTDKSWQIIKNEKAKRKDQRLIGLSFVQNFGHQSALWAGLKYVQDKCDCCISIDADLQHDESKIEEMVEAYLAGDEIVLGVKRNRGKENFFKRYLSLLFYKLMQFLGTAIEPNHADFRLLSSKALTALVAYEGKKIFLRGLIQKIRLQKSKVYYDVNDRVAGVSKYSFKDMTSLAISGITNNSIVPLRIIFLIGILILIFSSIMIIYTLYQYFLGEVLPGWASTVIPIYFMGGLIMISLGVIGEYLGRVFEHNNSSPTFIINEILE